jgi:3,4-dihydroxy 2-butanone 4-phosphate synthase/GTP cyclohydrolase II
MIRELGIGSVNLITNNPRKISELRRLGIAVPKRTPVEIPARPENVGYLRTKARRMNHLLRLVGASAAQSPGPHLLVPKET